ncbi:MAG: RNase adapter RapZ [Acidobacteria bacterium]|nr:MAG: RNase adapter RapZ [Acidobacteriota bacterium]
MNNRSARTSRFIVVTGVSGAGKSQAIRALEDLGFFCVDNLPVALISTFADLASSRGAVTRAAVVVDVREGKTLSAFPRVYAKLKRRKDLDPKLLFLDADDAMLLRRFSETRRPHPLAKTRSPKEGLREERRLLAPIRKLADHVVDTSHLNVHDLRRSVVAFATGSSAPSPMTVNVTSFSFRRGVPLEADLVFDVRFLKNPHFVPALRPLTGQDRRVARYVMTQASAKKFLRLTTALLRFLLPLYTAEGKSYLTVAIGCTGGQHRSVAIAEALAKKLGRIRGAKTRLRHREIAAAR